MEALLFRKKILDRLPELASGECPVPNSKFWDFYNDGGKEKLRESGIYVSRKDDDWVIRLADEIPAVVNQRKVDSFLETFEPNCVECGGGVFIEKKVCSNDTIQYRLRCQGFVETTVVSSGYGRYEGFYSKRNCYNYSGGRLGSPLPHVVVETLLANGIEIRDQEY